jgi:hypothetical protein
MLMNWHKASEELAGPSEDEEDEADDPQVTVAKLEHWASKQAEW